MTLMDTTEDTCIAVTGATGFIGATVCRTLHAAGYTVRILARSDARARALGDVVDETVQGDLEDCTALHGLVDGVFAVVHCAGVVRGARQADFDRVNVAGLQNLLAARSCSPSPMRRTGWRCARPRSTDRGIANCYRCSA
jgi:uncharacterized protein YbjT (DUF2867 family)